MTNAQRQTAKIKQALHLIKMHIDPAAKVKELRQDADLHNAIQLIVDVCRNAGILEVR